MYAQMILWLMLALISVTLPSHASKAIIPLRGDHYAFQRGSASSSINVELFIDLTCSSCMYAWPVLQEVYQTYRSSVNFLYYNFPLPYHQQGFIVSKAVNLVNRYSPVSVFKFMNHVIRNQRSIYNSATEDKTYVQVINLVEKWVTESTSVTPAQFKEGMSMQTSSGKAIEMNTRYMFKYCAIHGVSGTPQYKINGIDVMGLDSIEEWRGALDPLVAAANQGQQMLRGSLF